MRFDTKFLDKNYDDVIGDSDDDLLIPTLYIKNKDEFDRLLLKYVDTALNFYCDSDYDEEVRNSCFFDNELGVSREKLILILLWSNATYEDFCDPCSYLRKRIMFYDLNNYCDCDKKFYSNELNANVDISLVKNKLENETPYSFRILLKSVDDKEVYFEFPRVYAGICDNKGYIYAIQNSRDRVINESYRKKFERIFYMVNSGFDVFNDNFINYGIGNMKDVTPSFLIAANMVVGIIRSIGIRDIIVPSILISRWNSKIIVIKNKEKRLIENKVFDNERNDELRELYDKYLLIQSNLTEKFLRIFRRIGYHHSCVSVSSVPMEVGSDLVLKIYDCVDVCNNKILNETFSFEDSYFNLRK